MTTGRSNRGTAEDTKSRILDAAERMFIEVGYEAMSLRLVTSRAIVNLAAVNYHFRSKEVMVHTVLSRRLNPLNARRLALLDACEARWPGPELTCEHVLGALFSPALQLAREPAIGGPSFLRLIGRVYSDTSPFISAYLFRHYAPVYRRFFSAFSRTLPEISRAELGMRLHLTLKTVASVLASDEPGNLLEAFTEGRPMNDAQVLAQLTGHVIAALTARAPSQPQLRAMQSVMHISDEQQVEAIRRRVDAQAMLAAGEAPAPLWPGRRKAGIAEANSPDDAKGSGRGAGPVEPAVRLDQWLRIRQ